MVSDNTVELPFFPQYDTEYLNEENFRISWFESHFSQSHYNVHNKSKGSNACTLIAVIMAVKCHKHRIKINPPNYPLNLDLVHLFAVSMLEGNKTHEDLKLQNVLKHVNLNVPEALKYTGSATNKLVEWKSEIFMDSLYKSLGENIYKSWKEWHKTQFDNNNANLYVLLVADSRTVLFLIQYLSDTITLFDSHQHSAEKGAFIATSTLTKLKFLCRWYNDTMSKFYNSHPQLYELSFLHFNH